MDSCRSDQTKPQTGAFAVAATTTWNRLSPKVRTAASTEQFSPCCKDSSVHSWLISWLNPAPLTRYFHWWIMAPYTNWMIDWLIDHRNTRCIHNENGSWFAAEWVSSWYVKVSVTWYERPMAKCILHTGHLRRVVYRVGEPRILNVFFQMSYS